MSFKILTLGFIMAIELSLQAQAGNDEHFGLEFAGIRYGFGVGYLNRHFDQAEAVADFSLPCRWDLGRSWELKPRLELCLGSFGNDHVTAVIGSMGSILSLAPANSPVALELGVSATGLSECEFETRGIGSRFQIRSLFGLSWHIDKHVRVGYHFQHMSNGGLADENQGVNMHTISAAYRF
jgi:lipid A 3-O-deacylase